MTVTRLADWLAIDGITDAYRAVLGFVGEMDSASDEELAAAIVDEPLATGDGRIDALLAAVAEHLAYHRILPLPTWCFNSGRSLATAWFPIDYPSVRVRALISSPASFRSRLIFIDRSDLARV